MKRTLTILLLFFIAFNSHAQISPVYAPGAKAIGGYDPVSFFTESKPVMGKDSLSCNWNETAWYFSTETNRNLFLNDPEHYAPQYGGYCAYGTSQGHKAPTKVETWSIVNDKLYFNYNSKVKELWEKDKLALIEKADKAWPEIKDKK